MVIAGRCVARLAARDLVASVRRILQQGHRSSMPNNISPEVIEINRHRQTLVAHHPKVKNGKGPKPSGD